MVGFGFVWSEMVSLIQPYILERISSFTYFKNDQLDKLTLSKKKNKLIASCPSSNQTLTQVWTTQTSTGVRQAKSHPQHILGTIVNWKVYAPPKKVNKPFLLIGVIQEDVIKPGVHIFI